MYAEKSSESLSDISNDKLADEMVQTHRVCTLDDFQELARNLMRGIRDGMFNKVCF
jgi:hypothetical protein